MILFVFDIHVLHTCLLLFSMFPLSISLFSFYIFFILVFTAFSQNINVNRGERHKCFES